MSEDLDADLDPNLLNSELEQQKPARIELDDDSISLTGKNTGIMLLLEQQH